MMDISPVTHIFQEGYVRQYGIIEPGAANGEWVPIDVVVEPDGEHRVEVDLTTLEP